MGVPVEAFSDLLARVQADRNLSQSDIGRIGGVNRSRVSEWANGRSFPSPLTLERLAEHLGLDFDYLMRMCGYRLRDTSLAPDPDEVEALALYRLIPSEHRGTVKVMLRGLADQPVQPARRANARLEAADKNVEHVRPDLSNEGLGESQPTRLRRGKGKLALTHGTRWFRLSDSLLAVFQPLLALFTPNRDSGPAAATA